MIQLQTYLFAFAFSFFAYCTSSNDRAKSVESFYDLKMKTASGEVIEFSKFKGKKVLLVNTASKCGFSGQYADLEKFYQKHKDSVVVLGFPSNSFAQEPLEGENLTAVCLKDYGVTFPIFEKQPVKGKNQSEVFQWLSDETKNGWNDSRPKWNFYKFLVDENGELIETFSSRVLPSSEDITDLL